MIDMPISKIIERVCSETEYKEEDIRAMIKSKLEQLSGLISEEGAAHIIANELGVKLLETATGPCKIDSLFPGMKGASFNAKVLKKYELREFDTNNRQGKVASALLGDDSGIIRAVFWNEQTDFHKDLSEGDILQIQNAFVKKNNDRSEVHFNQGTRIEINPPGLSVEVKPLTTQRKTLSEITPSDRNVEVLGTIVQVYDPRFFEVCSLCGKRARLQEGIISCPEHGEVTPKYNYVMNLFLDDGSNNMRVVLWKDQIQTCLGMNDKDIQKFRESPDAFEPKKMELLGNIVKIKGRVNHNAQFERLEIVADEIDMKPDPNAELKRLEETSKNSTISGSAEKQGSKSQEKASVRKAPDKDKRDSHAEKTVSLDDLEDIEEEFI
ncbi:DUF2240 family protein [Candidatus Woesearchaeota archaeon]|nr:DUF2240 family protein [Candidatus Woesearchaeota archaeon]